MSRFARTFAREPLRIVGVLWPLALLAPFVPGLPRPTNGGLTWRQEATTALLLSATFALLLLRTLRSRRWRNAPKLRNALDSNTSPHSNTSSQSNTSSSRDESSPSSPGDAHGPSSSRRLFLALLLPLAAFVTWSAASTLWASNLFPALHYALTWTTYTLFFITLRRAAASARLLRNALMLLAVVVIVVSASNVVGYYGSQNSLLRQNGLGEPVAVCIPLFAALALRLRRTRAALLCATAATLGWLSMLEIAERAQLFGVLAGLTLLAAVMLARRASRPRTLARVVVLAVAFAACLVLQNVPSPFAQSFHRTVISRVKETSPEDVNTRARLLYWGAAIEMWRARPLTGAGAGNYDSAFPEARAVVVAKNPDSPLASINERYLATGAHNEYLQILGETGATGLTLFVVFAAALTFAALRALRRSTSPLAAGAFSSLAVFAVTSGASSISFRWMGSGLVFFFAVALVAKLAHDSRQNDAAESDDAMKPSRLASHATRRASFSSRLAPSLLSKSHALAGQAFALAASLVVLAAMCAQAADVSLVASAQSSADPARAESLFRAALALNPFDPAARFNYGVWLYQQKRDRDALPHLHFALARGFNTTTCYEYVAGAESNAGELDAAERTLAAGVRVYPRSVFMRVRHAASLRRAGRVGEAGLEMAAALLIDSRAARGWHELIENDIDAAIAAAKRDPSIAMPGELASDGMRLDDTVNAVLLENERRFPEAVSKGWRARMRDSARMLTP